MTYGNLNVDTVTTSTAGGILGAGNASIMKNRIINGAMVIDQRNAGASVTLAGGTTITLDRWTTYSAEGSKISIQQNAGSVTPPVGFNNYLGVTSLAATTPATEDIYVVRQYIEGYNVADLNWGSANAKTITLSFWIRSSVTGTYGGALKNGAGDYSYPFTYTITAANTWEQKSITVAGSTSGTWLKTNGLGLSLVFSLGSGSFYAGAAGSWTNNSYFTATGSTNLVATNGATWYLTGVQLEVGSNATGFEYVNYQTSLANCQRYYEKSYDMSSVAGAITTTGCMSSSRQNGQYGNQIQFRVSKRATPTVTVYSTSSGQSGYIFNDNQSNSLVATTIRVGENAFVTGAGSSALGEAQAFHYTASAEL